MATAGTYGKMLSKISRFNELIRVELGERDWAHSWQHADELMHPGIECDEWGNPQYETVCICGIDVSVHRPQCVNFLAGRRKKVGLTRLLPSATDQWVICRLHYPNPREWERQFGTHVNYPANGIWFPLEHNGAYLITKPYHQPTRADTAFAIAVIRLGRGVTGRMVTADYEAETARLEQEHEHNLYLKIQEEVGDGGLHIAPGKKTNTSWAPVNPIQKRQPQRPILSKPVDIVIAKR